MITFLKSAENRLDVIGDVTQNCWIHVVDPTTDEIERLAALGVPQDFITYPLDLDERSRTEREDDGTTLILIRIPFYESDKADVPFGTIPLGIILTDRFMLTVCRRQNDILQEFASGRIRGLSTAKRYRFVLRLLLHTASKYLLDLREINKTVDVLEDRLQASMRNKEVLDLLKYQKSLVYFTTALRGNQLVLERLQRGQMFRMYPEDEDLLEDVITENQQAIEMVNISSNILSSMMDAFASIISNNLNVVMKFLASVTIVLSIPTIITSFYGMNVGLPGEGWRWTFLAILAAMAVTSLVVVAIFTKRDWF